MRDNGVIGVAAMALGLVLGSLPMESLAQGRTVFAVDTIRAIRPWGPEAIYTFPHLRLPERPQVASRINRHVCIDFLEADPDTAGNDLFAMVWGDTVTGWMPRLNDISWEVHRPLAEVVDFEISAEGCGAYCEGFTRHYVYDLRTGNYQDFDSLFTAEGVSVVNDTLYKLWRTTLRDYVDTLEMGLSGPDLTTVDKETAQLVAVLYLDCLEERVDRAPYVHDVQPLTTGMRFFIARCAAHVDQNLDELDPVSFELPYGWLVRHMRPSVAGLFAP